MHVPTLDANCDRSPIQVRRPAQQNFLYTQSSITRISSALTWKRILTPSLANYTNYTNYTKEHKTTFHISTHPSYPIPSPSLRTSDRHASLVLTRALQRKTSTFAPLRFLSYAPIEPEHADYLHVGEPNRIGTCSRHHRGTLLDYLNSLFQ